MTILFFSRLFYPHIGGVERHVLEVGKQMVKDGHEVNIVTENNGWSTQEIVEGIRLHRMDVGPEGPMKKFRIWMWIERHKDLIARADIIHCHDVFFWYFPFRFFYIHKPVYTTFHGYETVFPPKKSAIFIRKISEVISFGNICVGDYIRKWYGTKPDFTTYGGVEILPTHTNTTNKHIGEKLKIIFIGRLENDTGIPVYLDALEKLKNKNIKFTFEAYGDGSLRKSAEKYGKVHGFVEDISSILKTATIVFASSYLSILEALSQKKQVFSVYDNPLKKDYLEMAPFCQWIAIENSSEKLAQKIIDNQHNMPQVNNTSNSVYNWAKKQTWKEMCSLYYKLYGNAIQL